MRIRRKYEILIKIDDTIHNHCRPAKAKTAKMTQRPKADVENGPIAIIQAFDYLFHLCSTEESNYIGVPKTDDIKDIANLPQYLFYRNLDNCLDELGGFLVVTKFLDGYLTGDKLAYRLEPQKLLTGVRKVLSIPQATHQGIEGFIHKLAFIVFSLTDVVEYDCHDSRWRMLLRRFEAIQNDEAGLLEGAKDFYRALDNASKDFLIAHFLKPTKKRLPSTMPPSRPVIEDFIPVLPNELILKIFSHLSGKDLLNCTAVSKTWRAYAHNPFLWKNISLADGVHPFPPPFYKPRPDTFENQWLISFGNKYFETHASEMPPRFYNQSTIMYSPAQDYFGLRWHNEMYDNENTRLISEWLRSERIKANWAKARPTNIAEVSVHDDGVITSIHAHAGLIASGSINMSLACYSLVEGRLRFFNKNAHGGSIWCIRISDDGSFIASGGMDRTVRVWESADGKLLKIFVGHTSIVRTLKILGRKIISGSRDKTIRIWNLDCEVEKLNCTILDHDYDGVRFAKIGNGMVISAGYEGMIKVWDFETGECLKALEGHTDRIYKIHFDRERNLLVSGGLDATIRIWNLNTLELIKCIPTKSGIINMAYNNDFLYSAHSDGTVKFWNWTTCHLMHELPNHPRYVSCMQVAPFDRLVTTNETGDVKIWDTITGECLSTLYLNNVNSPISQMTGSSTQLILATNRGDPTLVIVLDFDYPNP